jgi:diketogulonate reductase-like aldo/keto reductase
MLFSRRQALGGAAAIATTSGKALVQTTPLTRAIPHGAEALPVVGMGTWQTFDTDASVGVVDVCRALFDGGGRVIDSSPMYGRSETTVGEVLTQLNAAPRAFLATKVWTRGKAEGIAQMEQSIQRMGRVDLMQVHNLLDWKTHLPTLRAWKAAGKIRYWGITHYALSAFAEMEDILRAHKPDFVQLPYSVGVREAETRLLPACAEHGAAVLVMRPFEGGSLFADARKRPLPPWATELDCTSWAQLFLKFLIGHPAVTCVIPASSNPHHMADDMSAGRGRIPDAQMRQRIVDALS